MFFDAGDFVFAGGGDVRMRVGWGEWIVRLGLAEGRRREGRRT